MSFYNIQHFVVHIFITIIINILVENEPWFLVFSYFAIEKEDNQKMYYPSYETVDAINQGLTTKKNMGITLQYVNNGAVTDSSIIILKSINLY